MSIGKLQIDWKATTRTKAARGSVLYYIFTRAVFEIKKQEVEDDNLFGNLPSMPKMDEKLMRQYMDIVLRQRSLEDLTKKTLEQYEPKVSQPPSKIAPIKRSQWDVFNDGITLKSLNANQKIKRDYLAENEIWEAKKEATFKDYKKETLAKKMAYLLRDSL